MGEVFGRWFVDQADHQHGGHLEQLRRAHRPPTVTPDPAYPPELATIEYAVLPVHRCLRRSWPTRSPQDELLGTPAYPAPERICGLPTTDVYALSLVLHKA